MRTIKKFDNFSEDNVLIIVDVQKSFSKFFTNKYIEELNGYCKKFSEVYLIWDNHHEGKVPPDYLYQDNPPPPQDGELYKFPNVTKIVEKRYNYDVDVKFYKKLFTPDKFKEILNLENSKKLKKGDMFETNHGTAIVYIGNNHVWFHIGKKLLRTLTRLKGKNVTIVGGASNECLEDIFIASKSLGLKIQKNVNFIWSAKNCPIK